LGGNASCSCVELFSLTARVEMLSGNERNSAFRINTPDRMDIENIEGLAPNNFNTGLSDADLLRMNTTELDRFLSNTQLSDKQQQQMMEKRDALCEKADLEQRLQDRRHENVLITGGNVLLTGEIDRIKAQLGIFVEDRHEPKS
jgi:hypothetical protein